MIEIKKVDNKVRFNEMLKKVSLRFPVAEIAKKTGFSKGSVSEILKENRSPTDEFLKKFSEAYDIAPSDFGEVIEMFEKKKTSYYYPDVNASAGLDIAFNNQEANKIAVSIPNFGNDVDFINVYGDSMYPKYCSGEIIGVKEIEPKFINYGYAYVVILNDGEVYLKYIKKGKDDEHYLLASENNKYEPKEFHLSLIKKIYIIKGVITKTTM
jgi:phage repressor protein C with HTH and peptisase S24 domain